MNMGNFDIYGFLESQSIQKSGNKKMECETYIQRMIHESQKKIYMVPFMLYGC